MQQSKPLPTARECMRCELGLGRPALPLLRRRGDRRRRAPGTRRQKSSPLTSGPGEHRTPRGACGAQLLHKAAMRLRMELPTPARCCDIRTREPVAGLQRGRASAPTALHGLRHSAVREAASRPAGHLTLLERCRMWDRRPRAPEFAVLLRRPYDAQSDSAEALQPSLRDPNHRADLPPLGPAQTSTATPRCTSAMLPPGQSANPHLFPRFP